MWQGVVIIIGWALAEYYHSHMFPCQLQFTKFINMAYHIIPASTHSKDVTIQIDSRKLCRGIQIPPHDRHSQHQGQHDRPNKILYPLGCYPSFPYNSTMASGLDHTVPSTIPHLPTYSDDNTISSKINNNTYNIMGSNMQQPCQADQEGHSASVSSLDSLLPTLAPYQKLYFNLMGSEIKSIYIDIWLYEISHQMRGTMNQSLCD